MSHYPLFLVLGGDWTIGAYFREDIMKIGLAENFKAGSPARAVFKLDPTTLNAIYDRTDEYSEWVVPLENLCPRHAKCALPVPTASFCGECQKESGGTGEA